MNNDYVLMINISFLMKGKDIPPPWLFSTRAVFCSFKVVTALHGEEFAMITHMVRTVNKWQIGLDYPPFIL